VSHFKLRESARDAVNRPPFEMSLLPTGVLPAVPLFAARLVGALPSKRALAMLLALTTASNKKIQIGSSILNAASVIA
jgi:hypothetical protein